MQVVESQGHPGCQEREAEQADTREQFGKLQEEWQLWRLEDEGAVAVKVHWADGCGLLGAILLLQNYRTLTI